MNVSQDHHTVSAPAKAFLIGEYGVLDGVPALVAAVDIRAYAHAPRPHLGEQSAERTAVVEASMRHACVALCELGHQVDLRQESTPRVDSAAFRALDRKVGLGSSAAVCVSVVGHMLHRHGVELTPTQVHAIAALAHREAQGGGSGADVAAAALGGIVRFESGNAAPAPLPALAKVAFVDVGSPASTEELLRAVRSWADRNRPGYAQIVAKVAEASTLFVRGWEQQAQSSAAPTWFDDITAGTSLHVEAMRALGQQAGVEIITPSIQAVIELAAQHGIAAKPSGAGGGDLVALVASSQAQIDTFSRVLFDTLALNLLCGANVAPRGVQFESRPPVSSRLGRLFAGDIQQRRTRVALAAGMDATVLEGLDDGALSHDRADHMIENVVGTLSLPVGVATNVQINGRDYLVPMCVEEASVVAAASNAAKMIRAGGGFAAHVDPPWMIGQIELAMPRAQASNQGGTNGASGKHRPDHLAAGPGEAIERILMRKAELLALADRPHPRLVARGGGARDLEVRVLDDDLIVVHIVVDCRDAMGANLVNTMAEDLAPELEGITGWTAGLRILSNLSDKRCAHVRCRVPAEALASEGFPGERVASLVAAASRFASLDPYRATTHNKGTMNGIDAVVLATGNDWRAIEAGAHAYAARSGTYRPLCTWEVEREATPAGSCAEGSSAESGRVIGLLGKMSIPLAVGTVGGATVTHPSAQACLQLLGNPSAQGLAMILASIGMASNLAALRALATEGIQRGHMGLHARSIAVGAGAIGAEIDQLAERLIAVGEIKAQRAQALLSELRATRTLSPEHA